MKIKLTKTIILSKYEVEEAFDDINYTDYEFEEILDEFVNHHHEHEITGELYAELDKKFEDEAYEVEKID